MAETKENNSNKLDLLSLLSASLDLATAAGEIVRSVYATGKLGVRDKAVPDSDRLTPLLQKASSREAEDPQTIADVQSQKLIVGSLQRAFPRLRIVGEEGDLAIDKEDTIVVKLNSLDEHRNKLPAEKNLYDYEDIVVWVDPLDGTKEYTLGVVEAVTVLIGISFKGRALAGVVHVPFRDPVKNPSHTMWGIKGYGAFGFSKIANPEPNRLCLTTSRAHLTGEILRMVEKIAPTKVIHVGGAGYKALLVLEGVADVYFFPQDGTKKWDSCAVEAILEAAGCRLTDSYGDAIVYDPSAPLENTTGIIASAANHERFLIPRSEQTSSFSAAQLVAKPISRV